MQTKTIILVLLLFILPYTARQQNTQSTPDGWQRFAYGHVSIAIPADWKYKKVDMKKQGTFNLYYKGMAMVPDQSITIRLIEDYQKRDEYYKKFDAIDLPLDRIKTKAFVSGVNMNILIPPGSKGNQAVEVVIGGVKMANTLKEKILDHIFIDKDVRDYVAKENPAPSQSSGVDSRVVSYNYNTISNPPKNSTTENHQDISGYDSSSENLESYPNESEVKTTKSRSGRMTKMLLCDCGVSLNDLQKRTEGSTIFYQKKGTNIKHGPWTEYFDVNDAQAIKECYCYVDGVLHGRHVSWYSNGQMEKLLFNEDGKQHGEYKSWYENGNLSFEGMYDNGREVGMHWWYNEDGTCNSGYNYETGNSIPCSSF
jgi:antitoxin component YwqK of YwqJK toxin-antitoxin module